MSKISVYRIIFDEDYPLLFERREEFFADLERALDSPNVLPHQGLSLANIWTEEDWYLLAKYSNKPPGRFFGMMAEFFALTALARTHFEPAFGRFGEFLPIRLAEVEEPCFIFNIMYRLAALDTERSTFRNLAKRKILVFDEQLLQPNILFRDPTIGCLRLFCTSDGHGGLPELCIRHDLPGLSFEPQQVHRQTDE